jgi:hypothetical protein
MNKIFFILFLTPLVIFSQSSRPIRYRDFPVITNLDSLEKAVYAKTNRPQEYLNGLITLEKSRAALKSTKFGTDIEKAEKLAIQQRNSLGIASAQCLYGIWTVSDNVSKAIAKLIPATKYFESQKDTTAMLMCYSFMIIVNRSLRVNNAEIKTKDVRGSIQTIETYYNKIMALSENSSVVINKIIRRQAIINYYALVNKPDDLKEEKKALDEVLALINKNPAFEYLRYVFLVQGSTMYKLSGHYKEALMYQLAANKIGDNAEKALFNVNLANTYLLNEDYKNTIKYSQKAIAISMKNKSDGEGLDNEIIENLISAYSALSEAQFRLKNYDAAWRAKYSSDSLAYVNKKALTDRTYLELQTKYETEKKEQANKELREQQQRL